jgi:hypothetical protein
MLTDAALTDKYKKLSDLAQGEVDTGDTVRASAQRTMIDIAFSIACDLHLTLRRIAGVKGK